MNRPQDFPASRDVPDAAAGPARTPDAGIGGALVAAARLMQAGDMASAAENLERIVEFHPDHADALHLLGIAVYRQGRKEAGMARIARSLTLAGDRVDFHFNLAQIFFAEGRHDEAAGSYRRTLDLEPGHSGAHNGLGEVLGAGGRPNESIACYRRAIEADPEAAGAYDNLGRALVDLGAVDEALGCFRRVVALRPDAPAAHSNLGNLLRTREAFDDAIACYRRALALDPGFAEAYNGLGNALMELHRFDDALAAFRRLLEIKPEFPEVHSNLVHLLTHDARVTPGEILAVAKCWDKVYAAPLARRARRHANDANPERRLRIGYVSPDFRAHSVSSLFEPMMTVHDKRAVEVFCYAEVAAPDAVTARYRRVADHWRSTVGIGDAAVAERIREDRIDILVDLAGHSAGNRLLVFAERPAPVQVSHLVGISQTTGMTAMDYVLTDRWLTPNGFEARFSETLWRLRRGLVNFQPAPDWPGISPSPAKARGYVTFAAFGNPMRTSPPIVATWSRVLQATPGARLLLKHSCLTGGPMRERLLADFATYGVAERIDVEGLDHGWDAEMDVYERVDVVLDTFPTTGATTNCIAMWMGLPVVTLASEEAHDCCGASILHTAGLGAGVAGDADDFVARAAALAGDIRLLAELRAGLRERMRGSPLLDYEDCARAVEEAYRGMWRKWCADRA